jgi:hypothetical protein
MLVNDEDPLVGTVAVNNWLFTRKLLANGGEQRQGNAITDRNEAIRMPTYSPDLPIRPVPASNKLPPAINGAESATSKMSPKTEDGTVSDGGPMAWHSAEMAGGHWSDSYSFLGDTFTSEKGINPIIRNFELLGDGAGLSGAGGSVGAAPRAQQPPQSAKEKKLLADFEAYAKARDSEYTGTRRIG